MRAAPGAGCSERIGGCRRLDSVALPAPTGRIDVERLAFSFAPLARRSIRNVAFSLAAGESLGVIGAERVGQDDADPSDARIWKPQAGVVRLDGADISRWDRDALGRHVGYLPQDVELFAGTVGENIARLGERRAERFRAHRARRATRPCARDDFASARKATTPRSAMAAPCSRADNVSESHWRAHSTAIRDSSCSMSRTRISTSTAKPHLLAALRDLKSRGVTVVMVSHRPALMGQLDKLALLKNGALEMFGPSAAVMPRLRAVPHQPRRGFLTGENLGGTRMNSPIAPPDRSPIVAARRISPTPSQARSCARQSRQRLIPLAVAGRSAHTVGASLRRSLARSSPSASSRSS